MGRVIATPPPDQKLVSLMKTRVYIQYVSASVLLAWIWNKTRCKGYLGVMLVFIYFFTDRASLLFFLHDFLRRRPSA